MTGPLYEGGLNRGLNDPMSGMPDEGGAVFGLTELNGGTAVTPANVLNFLTMPNGGYTYDYRPNATTEDRVILGADGMCLVPGPSAGVLLGIAGLAIARRRRT